MQSYVSSEEPRLGRRERNKIKIKERLYTAAVELFTERGYDRTSIDEIAERADVARGTFFNHFQRKEDLISAWGDRRRERLVAMLKETAPHHEGAAVRLRQCMSILGQINDAEHQQTAEMLLAWVKAGHPLMEEPYVSDLFAAIVDEGTRSGELRADIVPQQVGNVLRDVYLGALYRWFREKPATPNGHLEKELQAALELLLRGILVASEA